jgi:hypothetical protein
MIYIFSSRIYEPMFVLYGVFGLGLSEAIIVLAAIILLAGSRDKAMVKAVFKSLYKIWLDVRDDVLCAERLPWRSLGARRVSRGGRVLQRRSQGRPAIRA